MSPEPLSAEDFDTQVAGIAGLYADFCLVLGVPVYRHKDSGRLGTFHPLHEAALRRRFLTLCGTRYGEAFEMAVRDALDLVDLNVACGKT